MVTNEDEGQRGKRRKEKGGESGTWETEGGSHDVIIERKVRIPLYLASSGAVAHHHIHDELKRRVCGR